MKPLLALSILASLAACATPPASIHASVASNCHPTDQQRLATLSAAQASTAKRDAIDTLFWGVPVRGLADKSDDHKAEIARLKACVGQ